MIAIKRLSYIPYIFTVVICFFILLPVGIYEYYKEFSWYSDDLENIIDDIEVLLEWNIKNERLMLKDFFHSIKDKTMEDLNEKMDLNLNNFKELTKGYLSKKNPWEIKNIIESSALKYPVYLKSDKEKIIAVSKGFPNLKSPIEDYSDPFFKVKDPDGRNWFVMEKVVEKSLYRIGTIINEEEVDTSFKKLIIDFVLYNEDPTFERFILDKNGRFLANESGIFPGRSISSKEHKNRADEIVKDFMDSLNSPNGKIVHFSWKVPEMKPEKILKKKVFVKYDSELHWFVGIGVDIEELDDYQVLELSELRKRFKEGMVGYMVFIALLFNMLLLGGVYLGSKTKSGFLLFKGFIEKANSTYEPIDCSRLPFEEFRELGEIANEMVEDRKRKKEIINSYMDKLRAANRMLRDKSDRDGLTGIHNRGYFDEALKKAWQDGIRHKKEISVGMIDIDYFKQYNDSYGHQKGDECLIIVAQAISSVLKRPYDLAARYGGEEFVVLFPDTSSQGAMNLAMEIKKSVGEKELEHKASKISPMVTFSMGLATIVPKMESSPEEIVKKADDALYKAKKEGRNRIVTS